MPNIISDPNNWARINVKRAHYALLINDPLNEGVDAPEHPEYAEPVPLVNTKTLNVSSADSSTTEYYDGVPKITVTSKSEKTVALTRANITQSEKKAILGLKTEGRGLTAEGSECIAPYVAFGYVTDKSNGGARYTWLLKGVWMQNEDNAASREQNVTMQNASLTGTFIERQCDGQIKIEADDDDPTIEDKTIFENWFKKETLNELITFGEPSGDGQ